MFLTASAAAGSIGLINSLGNLGGFVGPFVLGWMKDNMGSFNIGLYILSGSLVISAIVVASLKTSQGLVIFDKRNRGSIEGSAD